MKKYILAEKYKGDFRPIEINDNLERIFEDFEYGDVYEGQYQIWEYPEGKIFQVKVDREIQDKDYYSSPNTNLWYPKLVEIAEDTKKITEAYNRLSEPTKHTTLSQRLKQFFHPR